MCGIAGYYNVKVDQTQVDKLIKSLAHRGPDDQRFYTNGKTGLIHTRLSIIELSDLGAQPYRFGNLALVFNGELYNYIEVREELKKKGYTFQSNSDTEVLIKAFHCWQAECVLRFIGMFAFAVYDELKDELWLFRDRLGVKPLYYSFDNEALVFASELRALSVLNKKQDIDLNSVYFYFRFGYIPGNRSIFRSVSKLEAGHYIKLDHTGLKKTVYWSPSVNIDNTRSEGQWLDEIENLMISSFKYRMVSDVPVGIFLSGGVDSSLLAAILKKHYGNIRSFTIGFQQKEFDESPHAKKVANYLKIDHTESLLPLSEAKKILCDFYSVYDEPFADTSGIPTSFVARLAKDNGMKVVLSADGGDELFGGYTHYQHGLNLYNKINRLPYALRSAMGGISKSLFPAVLRKKIFSYNIEHRAYAFEELLRSKNATQLFESLLANQAHDEITNLLEYSGAQFLRDEQKNADSLQQMMLWDLQHYLTDDLLVKVDRATMHHGVECREPLLDHRLIELALQIPTHLRIKDGKGKYLERQLLSRYIPEHFFERKKQGFSIPLFAWFSEELDTMFKTYLSEENLASIGLLRIEEVQKEYAKYRYYKKRGKQYNIEKMWRLLSFALWWKKYMNTAIS